MHLGHLNLWWRRLLCRLFKHKQPFVDKPTALLCGRCGYVIEDRTDRLNSKLLRLRKRYKRGF